MPVDPSVIGPATLSITQAIGSFTTFLPKLADIRKEDGSNPEFVNDVRVGEVASVAVAVGVGAIVSSLTGSPVPTVVAVVVALGLVLMYETTLKASPKEGVSG